LNPTQTMHRLSEIDDWNNPDRSVFESVSLERQPQFEHYLGFPTTSRSYIVDHEIVLQNDNEIDCVDIDAHT
jgi:hypothetical protein